MKVSWLLLTYNRSNSVLRALPHCAAKAGAPWEEVVWVDNGSAYDERAAIEASVLTHLGANTSRVFLPQNQGVAKGYNTAHVLARGSHLVITGCDMLMPQDWLLAMRRCFELIPKLGVVSIYAGAIANHPERIRGKAYRDTNTGYNVQPAMPIGRRMFSRAVLERAGYLHEGFGMYGWEDVAWGHTAERACKELGLLSLNLIDFTAEHLGTEGNVGYDHKDEHEYWRWKKEQVNDPAKRELMNQLTNSNWPRFSPYA